ncbi:MAG: DUF4239 domain-containing protein [Acidobacteriota bacterium]
MLLNTDQNIYLVVLWVFLSITCLVLLNRIWAPSRRRVHNDVIGWQISIIGTIYAVMVGFMLYAVWANYQAAETNANSEANALINLFRSADGLAQPQRDQIQQAARHYADIVITQEWPEMDNLQVPLAGKQYIMQLWAVMTHTAATSSSEQTSLNEAMLQLSNLTEHRRVRILESETKMPTILWAVLVAGGVIVITSSCLIGSENLTLHFVLILALSLLVSMALVAIADIDQSFQGGVHISPIAFVRAQESMQPARPAAQ